jgi:hypothetical protein
MPVETWKAIADWGTIIFIALTVVSGSAALILGDRINEKQAEQLREFNKGLAIQQERAAKAERQLEEVKKRQEPRGVPGIIVSELKKAPPGKAIMEYQEGNPETFLFTGTLWSALTSAGWKIPEPIAVRSIADKKGAALAEIVFVRRNFDADSSKDILWNAFMKAGLTRLAAIGGPGQPEELHIRIGPKL